MIYLGYSKVDQLSGDKSTGLNRHQKGKVFSVETIGKSLPLSIIPNCPVLVFIVILSSFHSPPKKVCPYSSRAISLAILGKIEYIYP